MRHPRSAILWFSNENRAHCIVHILSITRFQLLQFHAARAFKYWIIYYAELNGWGTHAQVPADSARARSIIHTQTTTNSHDTYLISEIIYYYVFRNRLQTKWKDINLLFKLLLSFNTNTHAIYRCNYVCVLFRHTHTHIYGFGIIRSHALHTNTNTTVTMWAVLIK